MNPKSTETSTQEIVLQSWQSESLSQMFKNEHPVKITWTDICYTIPHGGNDKQILKGITGFAIPGETCYIMGASGAGKTTLLNILAQRSKSLRNGNIEGEILVNDRLALDENVFSQIGAYVMQDDVLFKHFTPKEALTFAARLKLKSSKSE